MTSSRSLSRLPENNWPISRPSCATARTMPQVKRRRVKRIRFIDRTFMSVKEGLLLGGFYRERRGVNKTLSEFYSSIANEQLDTPEKTVKDAIGSFPKIYPLKEPVKVGRSNVSHTVKRPKVEITQHEPRFHAPREVAIFKDMYGGDAYIDIAEIDDNGPVLFMNCDKDSSQVQKGEDVRRCYRLHSQCY